MVNEALAAFGDISIPGACSGLQI